MPIEGNNLGINASARMVRGGFNEKSSWPIEASIDHEFIQNILVRMGMWRGWKVR